MIWHECLIGSIYLDDLKGLLDGGIGVEGQLGVDLSGDLAGDDVEDLLSELDKETVEGGLNLLIEGLAVLLTVSDGSVDESGVLGLLGSGENQGGVGGGILGLVLANGCGSLVFLFTMKKILFNTYWRSHL